MPEFTYIDTRLLWLLMLLATGCVQYLLVGAVKLVVQLTREHRAKPELPAGEGIVLLDQARRERKA